jgi:hypothetical protein
LELTRKSATKLASLTALGAGAIALTTDEAQASIIVSTNTMVVGCGCVASSFDYDSLFDAFRTVYLSFGIAGAGRPYGGSQTSRFLEGVKGYGYVSTSLGATNPMSFRIVPGSLPDGSAPPMFMQLFQAGATWDAGAAAGTGSAWGGNGSYGFAVAHKRFDVRFTGTSPSNFASTTIASGSSFPNPNDPSYRYALFSFSDPNCPGGACYGWANIGVDLSGPGPVVTVRSWAYDDSGLKIAAGAGDPVPEPSTFALTGIAALALGARGIRRWRAARNQS